MKSDLPKVLHPIGGRAMFLHALASADGLSPEKTVVVIGPGAEAVAEATKTADPDAKTVVQKERLGTAHAVAQAREALAGAGGDALVLYGDTPFIKPKTLDAMTKARADGADVVILGFEAADPARYGRLVMEGDRLDRIV